MNDVSPSDDELVSSYLDSEATPDEVARVESDPGLLARAEEMRAAIELTATPVRVPELDLARIRATAVAASNTSGAVRDLRAAAADKQRRQQRAGRVLAVAAAFVLLGVAVTALRSIDRGDDDRSETVADFAGDDAGDDGGDGEDDSFNAMGAAADDDMASGDDGGDSGDDGDDAAFDAEIAPADTEAGDAPEEDVSEGDHDSGASGDSAALEEIRLFEPDATFDPLPAVLDPVGSPTELVDQVTRTATAYLADGDAEFSEVDDPLDVECGPVLLDALLGGGFTDADIATVLLGDATIVVAVAVDTDGLYWLISVDPGKCTDLQVELLDLG